MTKIKVTVRTMTPQEFQYAQQWATQEGWNPGLKDIECYSQLDPEGFFLAEVDGKPAGCGCAMIFSDTFSLVGVLIVKPEYRGGKVGLALIAKGSEHIGNRTSCFDSVEDKVHIYKLMGGHPQYPIMRCEMAAVTAPMPSEIVDLTTYPFDKLMKYDAAFFPADRSKLMKPWIDQKPDGAALGIISHGELAGYGVIRKAYTGFRLEPFYADTAALAETLLLALTSQVPAGSPVYINLPETNTAAMALMKKYAMKPQFKMVRMYRGPKPAECDISKVYSVMG